MELFIIVMVIAIAVGAYYVIDRSSKNVGDLSDLTPPSEPDVPVETPKPKRTTTKPPKSFSKMTKAELLAYAEENGIDVNKSDTKAEIVKKIKFDF
jgi:hypothetical protein